MLIIAFMAEGEINPKNMFVVLGNASKGVAMNYDALKEASVTVLMYGSFITVFIKFIISAFIIFMMAKMVNRMRLTYEVEEVVAGQGLRKRYNYFVRSVKSFEILILLNKAV